MTDTTKLRELLKAQETLQAEYEASPIASDDEKRLLEASCAADRAVYEAVFDALPALLDAADEMVRLRAEVAEQHRKVTSLREAWAPLCDKRCAETAMWNEDAFEHITSCAAYAPLPDASRPAVPATLRELHEAEERGAAWVLDLVDPDDEFMNDELRLGCSTCDGEGSVGIEHDETGEDSEECDDCCGSGNGRLMTAAEVCAKYREYGFGHAPSEVERAERAPFLEPRQFVSRCDACGEKHEGPCAVVMGPRRR